MSPDVLRRKAQKKSKRKRNAACGFCGGRAVCRVETVNGLPAAVKTCFDCGRKMELPPAVGGRRQTH